MANIDEYWSDEGIIISLLNFISGKPLPPTVTSDVNPFQYYPSDLPAGLWYFCSGVKKEGEGGFWLATGEACEVFSNSTLVGFRTTLLFHEGRAPHRHKTNWVMQEYTIKKKHTNNLKDERALCRVFLADENKPPSANSITNIDVKISINLGPTTNSNIRSLDPFLQTSSEMECILNGDYFELNDLDDLGTRSSSSANSSCLTMTSDKHFDSIALLRELEDEIVDSNARFNLSAPLKSKQVIIHPATSVSIINDKESLKVDNKQESSSNGVNVTASTSNSEAGRGNKRKMMKYLCFFFGF